MKNTTFTADELDALTKIRRFLLLAELVKWICHNMPEEIEVGFLAESDLDGHVNGPLLTKEERAKLKEMEDMMGTTIARLEGNSFLNHKKEEPFNRIPEGKMIKKSAVKQADMLWDIITIAVLQCKDVRPIKASSREPISSDEDGDINIW